jgi:flagellar protein FliJ
MANIVAFEKILTLRSTEKDLALKEYQSSVDHFESVATELYNLLKEKEDLEAALNNQIQSSLAIHEIHSYHYYINLLSEQIARVQSVVQQARSNMDIKQEDLTDSYVEMKKFEKLVEIKKYNEKLKIKKAENEFLDEISVQQFLRNRKR